MLLMIFLGSVVAAVAVVVYSYQVLFSGWGRGHKRGMVYAPPPLPPPPPNVQAMLAAVSLPSSSPKLATGSGAQPTVPAIANAPLPERFFPPLVKKAGPATSPPRRPARGSMPPPLPPRVTGEQSATIIVAEDITNVELAPHSHS